MNLEELVKKVTSDTSEKPYITLEDIQDVVNEQKTTNETLSAVTKERDELKIALEKKDSDYETLRSRIVDSVLKGEKVVKTDADKKNDKDEDRDNLSFKDLFKEI